MTEVVCPFCFARDKASRLLYRCLMSVSGVRGAGPCPPEQDEVWAAFSGRSAGPRSALLGPLFDPPPRGFGASRGLGRAACPRCGVATPVRSCRSCHSDLPSDYCDQDSRIIALVGPKAAGKSTCVTVLAHELRGRVGGRLGASLAAMGAATQIRYRELESDLYDQLRLPGPTQPAAMRFNDPLLFRLSMPRKRIRANGSRHTALVFFDAAGEDLDGAQATDRYTAYLAAADGVILLVDPLQLRPVRDLLAGSEQRLPTMETPPEQIVADLAAQLRGHRRGGSHGRVSTPLAVALTKSDMLRPFLPDGSPLGDNARHSEGQFDEAEQAAVHEEVKSLLDEWDGGALYRQLDRDFSDFSLFALSALGAPPPADAPADAPRQGPRPIRVEDPLLWILGRRGLVPVRKSK